MPVNVQIVSPSGIGNFGACHKKAVWDSELPPGRKSIPAADFGTVCHYYTMHSLGVAPPKGPTDAVIANARQLFKTLGEDAFFDQVRACAAKAVEELAKHPLPPGVQWLSEVSKYNAKWLPERRSREGVAGFGGSIDLMASDRSILWDLKFIKEIPQEIDMAYLWQVGSYHLLAEVPKTGLLLTSRDARQSVPVIFDWTTPDLRIVAGEIEGFLHQVTLQSFETYATCRRGPQCKFCDHQPRITEDGYRHPEYTERCPLWRIPKPVRPPPTPLVNPQTLKIFQPRPKTPSVPIL